MAATLALSAALLTTGPAWGQGGAGEGFSELFQSDFTRRDLPIIANGLSLDETQRKIVEALFEGYEDAIRDGVEALKDNWISQREKLATMNAEEMSKVIFGAVEEWAVKKRQLRAQLLDDIREQVLTPEQRERWPSIDRQLLRIKTLSKGRISGENVDLVNVLKEQHIEPATIAPLPPLVENYEIALDAALRARDAAVESQRNLFNESIQTGNPGPYMESVDRLLKARVAVRTIHEQHAAVMAAALPGEQAGAFLDAYRERAFPRVYRPTQVHRLLAAAKELPGLDPAVLSAVIDLEREYDGELNVINEALVDAIKRSDVQQEQSRAEVRVARMAGTRSSTPDAPVQDEFRKREELNQRYITRLQNLLTPEQWGQLPGAMEIGDRPLRPVASPENNASFTSPGGDQRPHERRGNRQTLGDRDIGTTRE